MAQDLGTSVATLRGVLGFAALEADRLSWQAASVIMPVLGSAAAQLESTLDALLVGYGALALVLAPLVAVLGRARPCRDRTDLCRRTRHTAIVMVRAQEPARDPRSR